MRDPTSVPEILRQRLPTRRYTLKSVCIVFLRNKENLRFGLKIIVFPFKSGYPLAIPISRYRYLGLIITAYVYKS